MLTTLVSNTTAAEKQLQLEVIKGQAVCHTKGLEDEQLFKCCIWQRSAMKTV